MPWQDIVAGGVDEWSDYGDTDDERAVDFAAAVEDSGREDSAGRVARVARDARAGSDRSSGGEETLDDARPVAELAGINRDGGGESDRDGARRAHSGREATRANDDSAANMGSGADAAKAHGAGLGVGVAWRGKRRNLEWQCSWIELRTREIDRHIERYEARLRVMKTSEGGKSNAEEKGGEERVNDGTDGTFLRTKIDASSSSLAPVVLGHPMFAAIRHARHDTPSDAKKRKTSENDGHGIVSTTTAQLSGSKAAGSTKELVDHANPKSEKKCKVMEGIEPKETNSDSDISTTALYEQIDAAQKRVASLKERLNQTAPKLSQKTLDGKFKTPTPKTKGEKHGEKTPRGSGKKLNNRTNNAFDINNVISAQGPAKYVERAIHETITTPKVRQASTFASPPQILTDDESSDEDISDEVFILRHAKLEADERVARAPIVRGRNGHKAAPTPTGKQVSLFDGEPSENAKGTTATPVTNGTE